MCKTLNVVPLATPSHLPAHHFFRREAPSAVAVAHTAPTPPPRANSCAPVAEQPPAPARRNRLLGEETERRRRRLTRAEHAKLRATRMSALPGTSASHAAGLPLRLSAGEGSLAQRVAQRRAERQEQRSERRLSSPRGAPTATPRGAIGWAPPLSPESRVPRSKSLPSFGCSPCSASSPSPLPLDQCPPGAGRGTATPDAATTPDATAAPTGACSDFVPHSGSTSARRPPRRPSLPAPLPANSSGRLRGGVRGSAAADATIGDRPATTTDEIPSTRVAASEVSHDNDDPLESESPLPYALDLGIGVASSSMLATVGQQMPYVI